MRWIQKKIEPPKLTEWRSRYNTDPNFGYDLLRQDSAVITALLAELLDEQGWLCAYTGIGIDENKCHIEHVKPQCHCEAAETVAYGNVVVCYPAPNQPCMTPYGAHKKDDWPSTEESHLFVSPLESTCETRFRFNLRGEIQPKDRNDLAATKTIQKLGLNHRELVNLRKAAITGTLGNNNQLPIDKARRRLNSLNARQSGRLDPFCFVLKQALTKHINRLQNIAKSKSRSKSQSAKKGKSKPKRSKT